MAAVTEVAIQLAELPELVRDVLAGVGHGAVGPHDDLVLVTGRRSGSAAPVELGGLSGPPRPPTGGRSVAGDGVHREHPTALVLPVRLQADRPRLLEELEGPVPEAQAQDVALVGEQVVA